MKGTIVLKEGGRDCYRLDSAVSFADSRMYRITPGACVHGWALPPPLLRWQDNP